MGRRRTGNVYRSGREKQGIVVYRQRVLQTATSLRVVSPVFRGHKPLKSQILIPSKNPDFCYGKNLIIRESSGNGGQHLNRSRSAPKRRLA